MYRAIELSKYIVSKCIDDGFPISNLQLQKILYYIQRDFLRIGKPAFPDAIEAWQFGPVVPNVYYYYCGFGAMPISIPEEKPWISIADRPIIDKIVENKIFARKMQIFHIGGRKFWKQCDQCTIVDRTDGKGSIKLYFCLQ